MKIKEKNQKNIALNERIEFQEKEISLKKNNLRELTSKIETLEKNISALTLSSNTHNNKQKIREALSCMIKENDNLKRRSKIQNTKCCLFFVCILYLICTLFFILDFVFDLNFHETIIVNFHVVALLFPIIV